MTDGSVILVELNGSDPEVTTNLRGHGVQVIHIDWDEVREGNTAHIEDALERIEELGVGDVMPEYHVGMPEIVRQLREALG